MILGIYGYHDTGKTLFLEKLMKELKKRRISAAAIKHIGTHERADKGKDTDRLASAGFSPVVGVAKKDLAIYLSEGADVWSAVGLVHRLAAVDVIFVEGFKREPMEKIAVGDIEELPGTKFRSEQIDDILDYIERNVEKERLKMMEVQCCDAECGAKKAERGDKMAKVKLSIKVNGKKVPANEFVKSMYWETLCGMSKSLKGVDGEIESIEISASKE